MEYGLLLLNENNLGSRQETQIVLLDFLRSSLTYGMNTTSHDCSAMDEINYGVAVKSHLSCIAWMRYLVQLECPEDGIKITIS